MEEIILVGVGDYYNNIVGPSLKRLESEGIARLTKTVDIKNLDVYSANHYVRKKGESLSDMLFELGEEDPIVLLGHANNYHVSDARDLVEKGYRVLIEKPFAINHSEWLIMNNLINHFPGKVGLLEYYLTKKALPLLYSANLIPDNSFLNNELIGDDISDFKNSFQEHVGRPLIVDTTVLEGEGLTGKLEHRGAHLSSKKLGGGMIQDLGIHALAPVLGLKYLISDPDDSSIVVMTAHNIDHFDYAMHQLGLPIADIAETYAHGTVTCKNGEYIEFHVGKYHTHNERYIRILGDKGEATLDLNDCKLSIDSPEFNPNNSLISLKDEFKYYPVLRSAIEELQGKTPLKFSITDTALKAQELVLNILTATIDEEAYSGVYNTGEDPKKIFELA